MATRLFSREHKARELLWHHALIIGLVQGMAITPGISRSGSTIAVALLLGVTRAPAVRFSFLCSIPAIMGATLLQLLRIDLASLATSETALAYGLGFVTAALSGWFALAFLVRLVKSGRFHYFAPYVAIAGILALWLIN